MKIAAVFAVLALAGCQAQLGPEARASFDLDLQQKAALQRELASGAITQAQYDQKASDLQDWFDAAASEADRAPTLGTPGEQWGAEHGFQEGMANMKAVTAPSQP